MHCKNLLPASTPDHPQAKLGYCPWRQVIPVRTTIPSLCSSSKDSSCKKQKNSSGNQSRKGIDLNHKIAMEASPPSLPAWDLIPHHGLFFPLSPASACCHAPSATQGDRRDELWGGCSDHSGGRSSGRRAQWWEEIRGRVERRPRLWEGAAGGTMTRAVGGSGGSSSGPYRGAADEGGPDCVSAGAEGAMKGSVDEGDASGWGWGWKKKWGQFGPFTCPIAAKLTMWTEKRPEGRNGPQIQQFRD